MLPSPWISAANPEPTIAITLGPSSQGLTAVAPTQSVTLAGTPNFIQPDLSGPVEYPVEEIPLAGPIASPNAEISGMSWYSDTLILLPQYPKRFGDKADGAVFAISRQAILDFINGNTSLPITPDLITFSAPGLEKLIQGYQGFEAIAFLGERVFLTIEARPHRMMGYLVAGYYHPDSKEIRLETANIIELPPQTDLDNMSAESIVVFGDRLVTLYEANGKQVNSLPQAYLFDASLQLRDRLPFPGVEFRITDATASDEFGRFWAINYYYPGDINLQAAEDPLAEQFGRGDSHRRSMTVERFVQFQFSEAGIVLGDSPPIQLSLSAQNESRNWEAIARLPGYGLLVATDKFPRTIFAFVPAFP